MRFSEAPRSYRWSAVASATLLLVAGVAALSGVERSGAFLLGASLVPFPVANALDVGGSATFHVAYSRGQWWAAGYIRGTPLWLTRLAAGFLAATGALVAIAALLRS